MKEKKNRNTKLTNKILSIRKAEYYQGRFDLKNTTKAKDDFWIFFKERPRKNMKVRRTLN